jgi:hypothetical protein
MVYGLDVFILRNYGAYCRRLLCGSLSFGSQNVGTSGDFMQGGCDCMWYPPVYDIWKVNKLQLQLHCIMACAVV